ncbi:MAG TPA: ATP-binding protein [Flavisolibacter sp.]|nr:ATP-binding protein [Flavisolibacter sp.]
MDEVIEFFNGLFSTSEWPPRWKCGYWSNFHGWLYIISELMIWTAYFLIPLIILNYLSKKKAALKFNRAYAYFAAFIVLCGSTHFLDAMMFWVPMYRLNSVVRLATAIVSLATVYHLVRILPEVFKQKTSVELEREIQKRIEVEKKLAEANKGLEAFVYLASHDLQEPLRKIRTYSTLLLETNKEKFDDKGKELLTKVVSSSERMQTMIKDILSLSTIDESAELSVIDPSNAVNQALEDLEIKILEKNAVINIGKLPSVVGNEAYLSQLFLNLLSNSLKFNARQPIITIKGEVKNDIAYISFSDNGIGISENNLDKIFGAFQRLHSKSDYEGSGIGLAVCKKIVDLHGGTISVNSKIGEGTEFIVELPASL